MSEKLELTEEEQKAKEYVDFYYYWLLNYSARNYHRELEKRGLIPSQAGEKFTYKEREQKKEIARTIYWGHPLSKIYPQIQDYEDPIDSLHDNYSFAGDATPDRPSTILESLYENETLGRWAKGIHGGGLEILGTSRACVSTDGHFSGYVIAKIDMLAPISSIIFEISKLKETKFKSFPDFLGAPVDSESQVEVNNYIYQSNVIKNSTEASFSVKDDAARAIGLWFWDVIDGPRSIFKNFSEAWKVTQGEKLPSSLVDDEIIDDTPQLNRDLSVVAEHSKKTIFIVQKEENKWKGIFFSVISRDQDSNKVKNIFRVPSRVVFTKLGYCSSDPSVFRRLYRNTKCCIDACEVLSLK